MHGDPLPVLRHRVARYQNDPSLSFWKLFKASKIWVQMVPSKKPPPPRVGLPIVKTIDLPFSHTKWSEFTLRWSIGADFDQFLAADDFADMLIKMAPNFFSVSQFWMLLCMLAKHCLVRTLYMLADFQIDWQLTAKTDLLHWISNWERCELR